MGKENTNLPAPKKEEKDKAGVCVPKKEKIIIPLKNESYVDYIKRCINS